MRTLCLNELSEIRGGGQNRSCMLMGGLAFGSALAGFWSGWGVATAIGVTTAAIAYGCFD
jgi:hypothetical protein